MAAVVIPVLAKFYPVGPLRAGSGACAECGFESETLAEREGFGFTPILLKMLIFSRFLLRSLLHCYNCDLQSLF